MSKIMLKQELLPTENLQSSKNYNDAETLWFL